MKVNVTIEELHAGVCIVRIGNRQMSRSFYNSMPRLHPKDIVSPKEKAIQCMCYVKTAKTPGFIVQYKDQAFVIEEKYVTALKRGLAIDAIASYRGIPLRPWLSCELQSVCRDLEIKGYHIGEFYNDGRPMMSPIHYDEDVPAPIRLRIKSDVEHLQSVFSNVSQYLVLS